MITADQKAAYDRDGFLTVQNFLPPALLAELRAETEALVAEAARLTAPTAAFELEPTHRPDAPAVRRIEMPHRHFDYFRAVVRHPAVLAGVTALLGPNVRVHNTKINLKPGHIGSPVEWHQDWCFYPHTNDDFLSVGLFLDDIGDENGGMQCIPASHRGAIHDHHNPESGYFCSSVDLARDELDRTGAVTCGGPAGSASFHHIRTLHGSGPNLSGRPRRLFLIGYAAADAWPLLGVEDWDAYEADLVCGVSTYAPRMVSLPCPLPYPLPPEARRRFSLFENQKRARRLAYERPAEAAAI